jgi:hypothetical protein
MTKSPSPTTSATPEEKLKVLFQDQALRNAQRQRDSSTFASRANAEFDLENVGRFAKPAAVTGITPTPQYPAGPNWSHDPVPTEPPLNMDVNAIEPVGESYEVEASVRALDEAAAPATQASDISSSDVVAVERKGDATPTETSGRYFPPAPSRKLVASPNHNNPNQQTEP